MIINIIAALIVIAVIALICAHIYYAVYDLINFKEFKARTLFNRKINKQQTNKSAPLKSNAAIIYDAMYTK